MRWMMIALLASLAALLLAAAGVARHIWLQRERLSGKQAVTTGGDEAIQAGTDTAGGAGVHAADENEL